MEDFINDKDTREKAIEALTLDINLITINYNNLDKLIIEMNSTLNWGTTIICAIFLFVSGKYLGNSFNTDSLFFKYIAILFIIYIVVYAAYKLRSMDLNMSINMLITESNKNLNYIKIFSIYKQLNKKPENSKLMNYYSDRMNSFSKDLNEQFNSTILKEKTNEIERTMKIITYLFGIGIGIFLLFIISFPIYYIYN